ncbi:hypothetical protein QTP88_008565 [Uroleucon formosanum]
MNESLCIKIYLRSFAKELKLCFRISTITLQPVQSSVKNLETIDFNRSFTPIFNVTSFENNQGLYYESYGDIRLSHLSWNLVTYLDLDTLISKYAMIMKYYEATRDICKKMTECCGSVEISNACELFIQQFSRATLPYLNEIDANHHSLMLAIGYKQTEETRIRRGLGYAFRHVANVLHGMCSKIDIEFIISKIIELNRTKANSINLRPEKTRISQTETNHATQQIEKQQQKLEKNLNFLQQQTNNSIKNINKLEFKTRILEQVFIFEVILNKYAYETQNLVAVLNAAIDGKLHTSMFTPQKLYKELLEIKMDIPIGNALPLEYDIIPDNNKNNLLKLLEESVKNVLPQNITNNIFIKDLNHLANIASDIRVPQGAITALVLFNIFIADQPTSPHTFVAEYADDKAILSTHENPIIASIQLQSHLSRLESWCRNWKIKINESKSCYITLPLNIKFALKFLLTTSQFHPHQAQNT